GIEVIRPGAFITRGEQRLLKREIVYPSDPVLNEKAGTDQRVGGVGSASTHVFRSCEPSSLVLDEERREAALGLQDFGQKLGVTGVLGAQHVGSVTFFLIVLAHGPERLSDYRVRRRGGDAHIRRVEINGDSLVAGRFAEVFPEQVHVFPEPRAIVVITTHRLIVVYLQ